MVSFIDNIVLINAILPKSSESAKTVSNKLFSIIVNTIYAGDILWNEEIFLKKQ